jgi:hypothetical protein
MFENLEIWSLVIVWKLEICYWKFEHNISCTKQSFSAKLNP